MDPYDRKSVRKAQKADKVRESQHGDVIRNLMSTIAGRAFMHDLLAKCHIWRSSSGILNALALSFSEGERNVGLQLLSFIDQFCGDKYLLMMREERERSTNNSDRERPGRDTDSTDSGSEHPGGEDAGGADQDGFREDADAPDPHGYYKGRGQSTRDSS